MFFLPPERSAAWVRPQQNARHYLVGHDAHQRTHHRRAERAPLRPEPGWVNAVETLDSKQTDLKQRAAVTVRTPGSAVEKPNTALKEQAVGARAAAWAKTVEKLRMRQMALKEREATVDAFGTTGEGNHRNQHQALMRTGASQGA
jgi:hypothetical protein